MNWNEQWALMSPRQKLERALLYLEMEDGDGAKEVLRDVLNSEEDACKSAAIKFGRYLLKGADITFDKGLLCWRLLGQTQTYNTDELYDISVNNEK